MQHLFPIAPVVKSTLRPLILVLLGGLVSVLTFVGETSTGQASVRNDKRMDGMAVHEQAPSVVSDVYVQRVSASDVYILVGATFTVTVIVANNGPDAGADVELVNKAPQAFVLLAVPSGCRYDAAEHATRCDVGTLPSMAEITYQLVYSATTSGAYAPQAIVSSSTFDPNFVNNDASTYVEVVPTDSAFLGFGYHISGTCCNYPVGEPITLTVTVHNSGPYTATGVKVEGRLPSHYTYVADNPACSAQLEEVTEYEMFVCHLSDLPPDHAAEQSVRLLPADSGTGLLNVWASSDNVDPYPHDNGAFLFLDAYIAYYDIAAYLHSYVTATTVGHRLQYRIGAVLSYYANTVATNVLITQTLSPEAQVIAVANGCTHDSAQHLVVCRAAELLPAYDVEYYGWADVVYQTVGAYTSAVVVSGDMPFVDAVPENNSALFTVVVRPQQGGVAGFARSGGRGLAGIEVSAMQEVTNPCPGWREVETTTTRFGDGGYALSYLDPGVYIFRFHDPTGYYADRYYAGATGPAGATRVTIESNTIIVDIDVNMQQASQAADQADPLAAATANHYLPLIATCWQR